MAVKSEEAPPLAGLAAEIDASVAAATESMKVAADEGDAEEPESGAEETPEPSASPAVEDAEVEEPEAGEEEPAVAGGLSDEVVERAVKAGFSLAEAKQYPNDSLLAAACSRVEGANGKAGSPEGAGDEDHGGEGSPDDVDLVSSIPDLDPEAYDELIVSGFKSMKEIIRRQESIIQELRGGRSQDWLATKLESVKGFTKDDPAKAEALKVKFSVLKAGYKAAKQDVTDDTVFGEATKLVLGGDMEAAKLESKGAAAKRRSGQLIRRPSGNRVEAKPDVDSDVASMLDRKFFAS